MNDKKRILRYGRYNYDMCRYELWERSKSSKVLLAISPSAYLEASTLTDEQRLRFQLTNIYDYQ